jgi:putative transcriptional regulator
MQNITYVHLRKTAAVIRFRLSELLANKVFHQGQRLDWKDVAEATGIHRTTLSRMLNTRGYNASTSNLDLLCRYFDCELGELAVYVPDEQIDVPFEKSFKGPKPLGGRQEAQSGA